MSDAVCCLLDDYLEDALAIRERYTFLAHLEQCADCSRKIDEQRRLEELVKRATLQATPVPADLVERIERRLLRKTRRARVAWVSALAASVVLALGVTGWIVRSLPRAHEVAKGSTTAASIEVPEEAVATNAPAHVTVTSPSEIVAVPVKSRDPAVTIVWLFPSRHTVAGEGPAVSHSLNPMNRSRQ